MASPIVMSRGRSPAVPFGKAATTSDINATVDNARNLGHPPGAYACPTSTVAMVTPALTMSAGGMAVLKSLTILLSLRRL